MRISDWSSDVCSSDLCGKDVHLAALGHQVAGLAGIGEERDGRLGIDEDQVGQAVELHGGELGQVGEALHGHPTRAALEAGREGLGQELGAGGGGDAAGVDQRVGPAGPAPYEQRGGLVAEEGVGELPNQGLVDGGSGGASAQREPKSVGAGKSDSVLVDPGGRLILKNTKNKKTKTQ